MPKNACCFIVAACWLALCVGPLAAAEFRPFTSGVMRGGERAEEIRVRVAGLNELVLAAVPVPTNELAHADWGDARLVAAGGKVTYLSDLKPVRIDQPYGTPRMDRSHRGGPITIGPQTFRRGLGTHAPSQLVFTLDGKYEWLEAWIGLDATAGQAGNVQFVVSDRPVRPGTSAPGKPRPAGITPQSLRLAIHDLIETFGPRYPRGREFLARLDTLESRGGTGCLSASVASGRGASSGSVVPETPALADKQPVPPGEKQPVPPGEKQPVPPDALAALAREALLANPLVDFDRLLVVKRRPVRGGQPVDPDTSFGWDMGLPRSSAGNSGLPKNAFDNEIAVLGPVSPGGKLTTLYRPGDQGFVGDVDLEFDAGKLLFSMQDARGRWQVCEIGADGTGFRQVSRGDQPDVDSYDPCYLPDGRIVFCSSACFQGVPCNFSNVEVLYRMDADGRNVRQLCFEQDHDFNPAMMPSGRVMYLRWEYSDLPHSNARRIFSMNPDGTGQMVYYGSNSYWPNGIFGARPVQDRPGKFVGVVAGHHGSHREGELVLFDVGRGRHEADGAVQRIPGRGRPVEPLVRDQLTAASWPKFVHPYPLSDKYFLVTCKLDGTAPWDLYLADVFDNLLPLHHAEGFGLFEPIPLRPTTRPPVLPDKVDPARNDAVVYLSDVYRGPGLAGVPRGAVKRLRLFTCHFAYQGMGGLLGTVGLDGPWDIKRVLGTVPVEPDGSAVFRIPANTPISVQPLDAEGKALQLMRSWLVGMPGETVSCAGCHEHPSSSPVSLSADALRRTPAEIAPWLGPPRNFSYKREVQPVIDRYCVGCHEGKAAGDGRPTVDLRGTVLTADYRSNIAGNGNGFGGRYFSVGYFELSRLVRRPGIESDMHLLRPAEYHADTTELVRLLVKGHYGVRLDAESWDRLVTWIDLNAPYHGTWKEIGWDPGRQRQRRRELRRLYAGVDEDPESLCDVPPAKVAFEPPAACGLAPGGTGCLPASAAPGVSVPGWPMDPAEAAKRQAAAGAAGGTGCLSASAAAGGTGCLSASASIDLGDGLRISLVLLPPGEFAMGDPEGDADERPLSRVRIPRPFWMGACEVTNRQYARFDPGHDSRFESKNGYQFGVTGFDLSGPEQPVVRVSWQEAMDFCAWLSRRTGRRFTLPTEAEWEYACRAGSAAATSFGPAAADFSPYANLADVKLQQFATDPYTVYQPLAVFTRYDDWIPRDTRYSDGGLVTVPVGRYRPNVWGLYDMHGNVSEWTRSTYRPYPYDPGDGRDAPTAEGKKVIRGGSWRDRPHLCRSASRWRYPSWQKVYNVGFRVASVPQ